jgi:DNA polymerase III gamma/tau subunit
MKIGKVFGFIFGVFALLLVLGGCAQPPEAERQAAKGAMDAAVSGGADKYAVADLDAAKKVWETAESQMNEKKYKEAQQSYVEAKAAFEKAGGTVEAGKKAASDQANAVLASIDADWKKLGAKTKALAKKMKNKKGAWVADSQTFRKGLAKAKEMIAADPAGAKPKLDELKAMVDKWENILKKMAAAPAKSPATKKVKKPATKKVKK